MSSKTPIILGAIVLLAAAGAIADPQFGVDVPPYPDRVGTEAWPGEDLAGPLGYGTDSWSAFVVNPMDFQPHSTGLGFIHWASGYVSAQGTDTFRFFTAPVHLPSGAKVIGARALTYDNSTTGYVRLFLIGVSCPTVSPEACIETSHLDFQTSTAASPGYESTWHVLGDFTWVNRDKDQSRLQYMYLRAYLSEGTSNLRVGPLAIFYQRQVSPAPVSASFGDVPTGHWAFQHVQALVASGITAGCGGGNFCPDTAVTRAQMAVFLAKALGLHFPDAW